MKGLVVNFDKTWKMLSQEKMLLESCNNGEGPWTILIDSRRTDTDEIVRYSALAPLGYREIALSDVGFDLSIGQGVPGFKKNNDRVEYLRNRDGEIEPIVVHQDFYDIVPDSRLVSQELILLMNLWQDPASGNYYEIKDDGDKEESIRFFGEKVEIRTPLLRHYQAARQLDLLLFTTSTVSLITDEPLSSFLNLEIPESKDDDHHIVLSRMIRKSSDLRKREIVSYLDVKKVLPPPLREKCGVWPWRNDDSEDWEKFIIGEDENGGQVCCTCEPNKLTKRGDNRDVPSYYKPVYFKHEVLNRYYDDTNLFTVTSNHLACGRKWGVTIHTDETDRVMVYLGDIGRSIPKTHHAHWRSFNIPPTRKMSRAAALRDFFNIPTETDNPEHQFKYAYERLQVAWSATWGWPLHRPPEGDDAQILKRLHIPANDTSAEFEAQILNLTRLLVDLLNGKELSRQLSPIKNEREIAKFERFLKEAGYAHLERDITFLRDLQRLRSKTAAHASGSDGKKYLDQVLSGKNRREYSIGLFEQAVVMLKDLAEFSEESSRCNGVELTEED